MSFFRTSAAAAAALAFSGACAVFAQVKPHDFTRGNESMQRGSVEMKESGLISERSRLGQKSVKLKEYNNSKDASALVEKSFYYSDKQSKLISADMPFGDTSKTFDASKRFSPKRDAWVSGGKTQRAFDTEKDLSKTYRGKIDVQKRSLLHKDHLERVYEDMQELSMQDVNRYQFRRSHPTDPGLKVQRAGGQLAPSENSSFLDVFSSRKNITIDTPLASFRGVDKKASRVREDPSPSRPGAQASPAGRAVAPQHSKVKGVEYLDAEKSAKYDFLRVPQGMRPKGKAVIKVETDD